MKFAKVASNLHTNPKVIIAGRDARDVFVFLLCKNAELECDGRIPGHYASRHYLATMVGLSVDAAEAALAALIQSTLVTQDLNGSVFITGWDDDWRPAASNSERSRAFRARQKSKKRLPKSKGATERNESATETQRSETQSNGCNALEERRVEEKREENKPDNDLAGWAGLSSRRRALLERHLAAALRLWALQDELRKRRPGSRALKPSAGRLLRVAECLEAGATESDCEAVLRHYASGKNPEWLNGETNWIPSNFDRTLGMVGASPGGSNGQGSLSDVLNRANAEAGAA